MPRGLAFGNSLGEATAASGPKCLALFFQQFFLVRRIKHLLWTVIGAAVPGHPENLSVDLQVDPYSSYLSGRYANVGSGFPGGFGYLTPAFKMLYFSLSMWPDFTLIGWLRITPTQAEQEWGRQYAALMALASQPIIHWLWHDYAVTSELNTGYSDAMFQNTLARVYNGGTEFATAEG